MDLDSMEMRMHGYRGIVRAVAEQFSGSPRGGYVGGYHIELLGELIARDIGPDQTVRLYREVAGQVGNPVFRAYAADPDFSAHIAGAIKRPSAIRITVEPEEPPIVIRPEDL
ncbi:MAG: hypothetical protein HYY37_06235 [Candidatus Aenigmarchaeota archaeon]|nr:hypothetical protein [Candidatus Aenigmarchaeota archaeon]